MDFDEVLLELGEMGKFQMTTYALVCLPVLFAAANSLSYVFTAGVPNYRCYVPHCDDPWLPNFNEDWVEYAIPGDKNNMGGDYRPSQCLRYLQNTTISGNATCSASSFLVEVEECKEWVFDEERTIVNEWNITCLKNQWKLSLVGTSHFAGIIVGSGMFGFMADKYGRKIIFVICIVLMSLSGMLQVISPEYITFTFLIFVNALGTSGVYPLAFIIGVEMVGKKKREMTGMALNYFYAMGEAFVALIAWLSLDWKVLQLVVSAPPIIFLAYYWIVPESVRWLLAKDKHSRAKIIVIRAAKINGVKLSTTVMEAFDEENTMLNQKTPAEREKNAIIPVLKTLCSHRKLVVRFLIVYFIWAINAFVYYGLSVNSTSMGGDKYLNFALVCLIEIPGYSIAWIAIRKIGRRLSLVCSLLLCGITCTLTLLVPLDMTWAVTVLFLMGKLGVTAAFGIVYVHTAEMLPTTVRSGGVGSASTMARFGALLAPFVPLLGVYVQPLPMIMFGGAAVLAGLLALKLPETLGTKLPETVEEALDI